MEVTWSWLCAERKNQYNHLSCTEVMNLLHNSVSCFGFACASNANFGNYAFNCGY